jgi:hypothetical protein
MTAVDMRCDLCGSPDFVGVASVPGFPVSLAWCKHCLERGAMPLFTAEVTLGYNEMDVAETKKEVGLEAMESIAAEWFLDSWFYIPADYGLDGPGQKPVEGPGRYMKLRDYLRTL